MSGYTGVPRRPRSPLPAAFRGFGVRRLPRRPRFREMVFGRTWDVATVTFSHKDGSQDRFEGRIDTSWGTAVTFEFEGSWYSVSINLAHDRGNLDFYLVEGEV